MKMRNTLILVVLAVAAFAYLKFYDSKLQSTEEKLANKGEIVDKERVDRDETNNIIIRNAEGVIKLTKKDNVWSITEPVADRAESMKMASLFTALETLRGRQVKDLKDPKESAKEFGVSKGEMSIRVESEKPVEILLGKDTAVEGRVYARIEGEDTIYTVEKTLRDEIAKGVKEWRDRKLSDLTASQVTKLTLKTAKGEMELEKQGANWSFTKPFKARGDNQKISDLIANATTPQIEDFISDSKDLGAFGLNEPRATLTFVAEGQKDPVVLTVGSVKPEKKDEKKEEKPEDKKPGENKAPTPPQHVHVKLSTRAGVVTVPAAIESLINTQPNDLRDQSLIRVQSDIVDRITIESAKGKIVLGRKGEEWVRKIDGKTDETINGSAAAKLLNTLVSTQVTRFVADMASDLKGFGLDQPQVTVTLSSYSTEGTPETNPGEKPIVKLLLGRFEGDAGYAKLDDEPFIVSVPASLLGEIWTDPLQWQDLKVYELKKEDIAELEVTRSGQTPTKLAQEKDKGWKLAQGEGTLNQTNAQSLVNTISALRAVRWIGATDPAAHGTDKPTLVVAFTMADKTKGKLTVGKQAPDQMWWTTADGKQGTFVITQGDFDAMNATLVDGQKSAAAPAPGAPAPAAAAPAPVSVTTPPVTIQPAPSAPGAPAAAPVTPAPAPSPAPQPQEPPKPTEVPGGSATPAPESAPKP